jgi:hypothetical protein
MLALTRRVVTEYLWRHRAMGFTFYIKLAAEIPIYIAVDHRSEIGNFLMRTQSLRNLFDGPEESPF